jgi:hypothetical protein
VSQLVEQARKDGWEILEIDHVRRRVKVRREHGRRSSDERTDGARSPQD